MNLDEAIQHCLEVMNKCETKCEKEHLELFNFLTKLQLVKNVVDVNLKILNTTYELTNLERGKQWALQIIKDCIDEDYREDALK